MLSQLSAAFFIALIGVSNCPPRLRAKSVLLLVMKQGPSSVIVSSRISVNIGRLTEPGETFVYKIVDSERRAWVLLFERVGAGMSPEAAAGL